MKKKKKTILLVDNEVDILDFLGYNLKKEGFEVHIAQSGVEGIRIAETILPDIIVLDIMMPGIDGIETCRKLRENPDLQNTPILFLTALRDDITEESAMNACGDGYITKPLRPKVFLSHLKAHLRRGKSTDEAGKSNHKRKFGSLKINTKKRTVKLNGQKIPLAKKEFNLLVLLSSDPGTVFTREQIFREVWGIEVLLNTRTLDVHVREIRKKIGKEFISTIKGIGYKFMYENMDE